MKKSKYLGCCLVFLLALLLLCGCGQEASDEEVSYEPIQEGEAARDFSIELSDGSSFQLSEHQGQVVLLNFWATWCGPCVNEMPGFEMLRQAYGDELFILAISCDEDAAAAEEFLEERGFSFATALDPQHEALALYPTDSIPYSLLIDEQGQVVKVVVGGGDPDSTLAYYQSLIDPLLDK